VTEPAALVDRVFDEVERYGTTYAALVVQGDEVLAERYGNALPSFVHDDTPVTPDTPLHSWSIAKSVLHAAVGVLVGDGRLELHAPAAVPEWSAADDARHPITLDQMLAMRDGLDFLEDYVDETRSDVIDMLFGSGQHDVAHFAADRPLAHEPGTFFNYSSGTSNIVSRLVRDQVGDTDAFLRATVFGPIGMDSAWIKCDDAGTFIGSSYVYATARDWVKFGQCYLHDGVSNGGRVVPEGWVAHGVTPRSVDPTDGRTYGAHWWCLEDARNSFYASGYEGQRILVCPELDLIVVRFGRSTSDQYDALADWSRDVVAAFG
jgi:CubicO group peptidase (beta-lactamase class C family)